MPAAPSSPSRGRLRPSTQGRPRRSPEVQDRSISQGSEQEQEHDATKAKRVSFGRVEETHEGRRLTGQEAWRAYRKTLEAKQRAEDRNQERAEEQRVKQRTQGVQTKEHGREMRVKEEFDEEDGEESAQAQRAVATQRLRTWVADTAHRSWPRKRLRGEDIGQEEDDDEQGVTEDNTGPSASEMAGAAERLFLHPEPLDTRESLDQRERDLETLRLYLPRLETNMQQVRSVMEHQGEW